MEKHNDVLDAASELQQATLDAQLAQARKLCKPARVPNADGVFEDTECEDCFAEIPLARMKVAVHNNLCVHCAGDREKASKRWAR